MGLVRKLRAMLGMGVVWGLAWVPLTLTSVVIVSLVAGQWPPWRLLAETTAAGALAGAASGLIFGGLLAVAERRRTVASLSSTRTALWGALAAVAPPALFALAVIARIQYPWVYVVPMFGRILGLTGILGAVCAGGVLYVARRAPALPDEADEPRRLGRR
jgi:hypothetical protein